MADLDYESVPGGSLIALPADQRFAYWLSVVRLPITEQLFLLSNQTGATIRGLGKEYSLTHAQVRSVAFTIVRLAIGEISLAQLPSVLSTELRLANDTAQKMAAEIEQILVSGNLNLSRSGEDTAEEGEKVIEEAVSAGARNVLNLKERSQPPPPPPMPSESKPTKA